MSGYKEPVLIFENVGAEDEDVKYNWYLMPEREAPPICYFEYIGDDEYTGDDDRCSGPPRWLCVDHAEPDAIEFHEYFCWHHAAGILMYLEGVMS